jgi:hypothetical protein
MTRDMSQSARLASAEELSDRVAMRQFTNLNGTVERPVTAAYSEPQRDV